MLKLKMKDVGSFKPLELSDLQTERLLALKDPLNEVICDVDCGLHG